MVYNFQEEWVICRVFNKSPEGKKVSMASSGVVRSPELLPSLMDVSTDDHHHNAVEREKLYYNGFEHDSKENVRMRGSSDEAELLEEMCPRMEFEGLEFGAMVGMMSGSMPMDLDCCLWDY